MWPEIPIIHRVWRPNWEMATRVVYWTNGMSSVRFGAEDEDEEIKRMENGIHLNQCQMEWSRILLWSAPPAGYIDWDRDAAAWVDDDCGRVCVLGRDGTGPQPDYIYATGLLVFIPSFAAEPVRNTLTWPPNEAFAAAAAAAQSCEPEQGPTSAFIMVAWCCCCWWRSSSRRSHKTHFFFPSSSRVRSRRYTLKRFSWG